jgi:hypothetical protein
MTKESGFRITSSERGFDPRSCKGPGTCIRILVPACPGYDLYLKPLTSDVHLTPSEAISATHLLQ